MNNTSTDWKSVRQIFGLAYVYIYIQLPPGFCVADPFGATPFAPPQEHVDASSVQWALLQFCVGEGTLKRQRLLFLHVNGQDKKGRGKPVLGSWIHMENHATSSNIQDSNHLVECRLNSIYSYLFLVLFFECRFCLLEISRGQVGQVTKPGPGPSDKWLQCLLFESASLAKFQLFMAKNSQFLVLDSKQVMVNSVNSPYFSVKKNHIFDA